MKLSVPVFKLKRRARILARQAQMPLHAALDKVAREEGFRGWSHLSAALGDHRPGQAVLAQLEPGDLVLLGARPGQGKTLLGLEIAVAAARTGRHGLFFTLEYNQTDVIDRLRALGVDPARLGSFFVLTSDDISADHVIARLRAAPQGAVAVIDYLQLLDQKRRNPELGIQIRTLKEFAAVSGAIVVLISQIDRGFDLKTKKLPELSDVRLPNPLDLSLFSKTCFLHDGEMRLDDVA